MRSLWNLTPKDGLLTYSPNFSCAPIACRLPHVLCRPVFKNFLISIFISLQMAWAAPEKSSEMEAKDSCSSTGDQPETSPASVDLKQITQDILKLRDVENRPVVLTISPDLQSAVRALFTMNPKTISKLEQFYALLFYLAKYRTIKDRAFAFDPKSVVNLLISSKVFSDPKFPNHISGVELTYNPHKEIASYQVYFDSKELRLPLNQGKGFSNFREGMCQTAKELVFYGGFTFDVEMTVNHNHVFVSKFKNVDLFGRFGSRGLVNVDIQYVSLRSVEFLSGSPMGVVRAKVSKKEFEINAHSMLLQLVSSIVTDKSEQAIDW
jgi:hypothetical protein